MVEGGCTVEIGKVIVTKGYLAVDLNELGLVDAEGQQMRICVDGLLVSALHDEGFTFAEIQVNNHRLILLFGFILQILLPFLHIPQHPLSISLLQANLYHPHHMPTISRIALNQPIVYLFHLVHLPHRPVAFSQANVVLLFVSV